MFQSTSWFLTSTFSANSVRSTCISDSQEHSTEGTWFELSYSRFFRELTDGAGLLYQTKAQYECYTPQPFIYLPSFACPCVRLISILLLPQTATRRETKGTRVLYALCGLKSLYFVRSGFVYDVGVRDEVGSSIYTYKHIQ